MDNRLQHIRNWPERAQKAKWSAATLALNCGVSLRTLQRHFLKEIGKNPKKWLAEQRQLHGKEVLKKCSCIKEIAQILATNIRTISRGISKRIGDIALPR